MQAKVRFLNNAVNLNTTLWPKNERTVVVPQNRLHVCAHYTLYFDEYTDTPLKRQLGEMGMSPSWPTAVDRGQLDLEIKFHA